MRVPVPVILAFLAVTGSAQAAELRSVTRQQPVAADGPFRGAAPGRFNLVGVSWRGTGGVWFRTRRLAGGWSAWRTAAPEPEDVGDTPRGWQLGNPYWTGPSNAIEYRTSGRVRRVRATFVWSVADAVPLRALALAGAPAIIPRRAWAGSDTALRRAAPSYADQLRFAVVHHTAGASPATRSQSIAMVRAVAAYHVHSNGWNDIGYNFLVDRFGQVFEGRYGGVDRNVIGAHAQGFNAGSVGVALLGTYASTTPSAAARAALARLLAWRLDVAHVDPLSLVSYISSGNPKYRAGVPVLLRAVAGHRDTGFTSCPGERVYGLLSGVAQAAAASGLPKLYSPAARANAGLVRFTARLSSALPWAVSVTDDTGAAVASGTGSGTRVDWTWDARAALLTRYRWTISAGPSVRPAAGVLTAGTADLLLAASATPTTISPDGDGDADHAVVTYRLGAAAYVTGVLVDSEGTPLATLIDGPRPFGSQTFRWTADGLPDGGYSIVFTAHLGNRTATVPVGIAVNRTLTRFALGAPAISPNADGRFDVLPIAFAVTTPADVVVEARRAGALPIALFTGSLPAGDHALTWNGESAPGARALDGRYSLAVRAASPAGLVEQVRPVVVDTAAPKLRLVSRRPLRVRVSEPGTLYVTADGVPASVVISRAGVVRLSAAGTRISAVAEDRAGNRSVRLRLR